ncbi:MAG: hypothetical protein O6758_10500 [Planctomycetota bacterium]|nr:hypothetical protein [Planctomycetota bacterium]
MTRLLGLDTAVVTPNLGGNTTVSISGGPGDAAVFGSFANLILGQSLVASVTMRREPLN